jgi:hypothetical protein
MILRHDLGMRSVSVKFIAQLLTAQQKHCLSVASDLLECAELCPNFFKNIVTSDDTLPYGYDPNTKHKSSLGL